MEFETQPRTNGGNKANKATTAIEAKGGNRDQLGDVCKKEAWVRDLREIRESERSEREISVKVRDRRESERNFSERA